MLRPLCRAFFYGSSGNSGDCKRHHSPAFAPALGGFPMAGLCCNGRESQRQLNKNNSSIGTGLSPCATPCFATCCNHSGLAFTWPHSGQHHRIQSPEIPEEPKKNSAGASAQRPRRANHHHRWPTSPRRPNGTEPKDTHTLSIACHY